MADIKHSIQIASTPENVFTLAATAQGFTKWWAQDVTESAGVVDLGFFNRKTLYRLRPVDSRPPAFMDWICETGSEWKDTHITFQLEAQGTGTLLRFTHGGWQSATDYFTNCNTTWGELMYRLKAAAEGNTPGPLFLKDTLAY